MIFVVLIVLKRFMTGSQNEGPFRLSGSERPFSPFFLSSRPESLLQLILIVLYAMIFAATTRRRSESIFIISINCFGFVQ